MRLPDLGVPAPYTRADGSRIYMVPDIAESLTPSPSGPLPPGHFPSVTTIAHGRTDFYIRRAMQAGGEGAEEEREVSAERGGRVHHCAERFLQGGEPVPSIEAEPYWRSLRPWLLANVEEVLLLEARVWSLDGHAGTLDLLARIKGIGLSIIDYKTTAAGLKRTGKTSRLGRKGCKTKHTPQLSAYWQAVLERYELEAAAGIVLVIYPDRELDAHIYDADELAETYTTTFMDELDAWYQLEEGAR